MSKKTTKRKYTAKEATELCTRRSSDEEDNVLSEGGSDESVFDSDQARDFLEGIDPAFEL